MAAGICGRDQAADVTQEVFLQLWCQPERFDPARGTLRTLLLTMAHHRAIDLLRAGAARQAREREHAPGDFVQPDVGSDLLAEEHATRVTRALLQLPMERRDAIVTAYYGQCTYGEAAAVLGQPEGTIKARIRAGLRQLREALGDTDPGPA
jgi:RNA polymerase sigma-70 factor (ECF subfamily)